MNKKLKTLIVILIVIAIPVAFWFSSLIKCEILTSKYYDDFENAYTQNTMLGAMESFKVLSCDGKSAEVYYISKDMTSANVLSFENKDGVWIQTNWKTLWSSSGSASDVIFPYWWHFIYSVL